MNLDGLPKVSVCVIVYNQSSYVLECLESIAAQRCHFQFEVVIRDDASTDGSADVIAGFILKHHLTNFTLYRAENNEGMMQNLSKAFLLCRGDYIAFCEADDYWTDDLKLEKQVTLMQNNPGCTLSVHPCYLHRTKRNRKSVGFHKGNEVKRFGPKEILMNSGQSSPSASYVFRREVVDCFPPWFISVPMGDFFIEMYSMKHGFGLYMPDVMCAYRVFSQGSWSDQMRKSGGRKMINSQLEMKRYIGYLEADKVFSEFSFDLVNSSIFVGLAIGYLVEKDFHGFKENIVESYAIYHFSSLTQSWLYRLRNTPRLAFILINVKSFLYIILKYK